MLERIEGTQASADLRTTEREFLSQLVLMPISLHMSRQIHRSVYLFTRSCSSSSPLGSRHSTQSRVPRRWRRYLLGSMTAGPSQLASEPILFCLAQTPSKTSRTACQSKKCSLLGWSLTPLRSERFYTKVWARKDYVFGLVSHLFVKQIS